MNETKRCFEPVVNHHTRLLILGSLPSEQSLLKGEYYGNKQNKFWELIGAVIDVDLRALPYAARLDRLRAHGVGLWDVIAEAERPGSLDAAIRRATPNALAELLSTLPALQAVAFNGGTAARQGRRLVSAIPHITVLDLPSSSPAHTIPLEKKKAAWSALGAFLSA